MNADVPNPSVVSFVEDIARLNRIWDDTSTFWTPGDCALRIHGHPITLVHWKAVYSYGKKGQCRGTRNKWADWQVCGPSRGGGVVVLLMTPPLPPPQYIVERYRALLPDGFWAKFSMKGKRHSYTTITNCLRTQHALADKSTAEKARQEYGASFDTVFSYHHGGRQRVMNTNQKIAAKYRELHPEECA
jgi:hypothetical protein